jgi:hypothetical protein
VTQKDLENTECSPESVIDHFCKTASVNEVAFETIHHLAVFANIRPLYLRKIAEKIMSLENRNVFIGEYVIKILIIILDRLSVGAEGESKNF